MFSSTQPVGLFSPEHLIFLAGSAFFCSAMIFTGGRLGQKGRKRLLIALWSAFTVIELCKYVHFGIHPDEFNIKTGLPFHLCSISLFTYPLAVFTENKIFRNFIFAVNMPGALFALITPDIGNATALSFYFLHLIIINGPVSGTLTGQLADWVGEDAYMLPMVGLLAAVWALLYAPFAASDLIRKKEDKSK